MYKLEKLSALFEAALDLDAPLSAESRFADLPGWDSMNAMRMIAHIEKDFQTKLPIKDYLNAQTLGDVHRLIAKD
ncbi:MAG: acyl carrier protein [Gammaproteobacteria bacterium]